MCLAALPHYFEYNKYSLRGKTAKPAQKPNFEKKPEESEKKEENEQIKENKESDEEEDDVRLL